MTTAPAVTRGWYLPVEGVDATRAGLLDALQDLDQPFAVVWSDRGPAVARGGQAILGGAMPAGAMPLLAWVPDLTPDRLGDPAFRQAYGVRVAYVAGAMANGIGSAEVVVAMARAGMLGFFGSAGLPTPRIEAAIDRIQREVGGLPYGVNLIHSPQDPRQEDETVALFLRRGVRTVSASAFMKLTPAVVRFRASGMHVGPSGEIIVPNRILAKISREEVAVQFLRPPPGSLLRQLVETGQITPGEAELAERVPMADDLTAEADSGGHTDNQAAPVLLPLMGALRDRIARETGSDRVVRIGAAGGIGTPAAAAAAFTLGAAYVLTGTVNQACVEAGTSDMVRSLLAEAGPADVTMAPAADMFEQGVEVQVLKRGTLFAMRARKLHELYRAYDGLDDLPPAERVKLERQILRRPAAEVWDECERFFAERDPAQLERAARDPRHKMALVFRWYLGLSSRWAITGDEGRKMDAQIWCGPAIGGFNEWTRGTFLESPENRSVGVVGANIMAGAAAITRARILLMQGIDPGPEAQTWTPRPLA